MTDDEETKLRADLMQARMDADAEKHDKGVLCSVLGQVNRRANELEDQRDQLLSQLDKAARVDAFQTAIDMLRRTATDPGAARNYVQCDIAWDHAIAPGLPFRQCSIVFRRDGALSPGDIVREALVAKSKLADLAIDLISKWNPHESIKQVLLAEIEKLKNTPEANPALGEIVKP